MFTYIHLRAYRHAFIGVVGGAILLLVSTALASIVTGSSTTNVSADVTFTQLSLAKPADVATGDLMLANVSLNGGTPASITPPSGWNLIARTDNDTNIGIASYWKVAVASESSVFTWSITPQTRAVGGITRYSGIDPVYPINVSAGAFGRGTVASAPSIMTTVPNAQVVALFATNNGTAMSMNFSTSTGMTVEYTAKNTPFGPSTMLEDVAQAGTGATGVRFSTFSQGVQRDWVAQQIALRPYVPIAFDATSSGHINAEGINNPTLVFSHTISGVNRILLVGVNEVEEGGAPDHITGVTYNGIPMTRVSTANPHSINWRGYIYALVNPSLGTHNIVITSTIAQSASNAIIAIGASYTGVDQESQPDAINSNGCPNFSTSCSVSVTPMHNNSWVVGFASNSNGHDMLAGAGTSVQHNITGGYGSAWIESAANPVATPVLTTLNVNDGASSFGAFIMQAVAISPAGSQ